MDLPILVSTCDFCGKFTVKWMDRGCCVNNRNKAYGKSFGCLRCFLGAFFWFSILFSGIIQRIAIEDGSTGWLLAEWMDVNDHSLPASSRVVALWPPPFADAAGS